MKNLHHCLILLIAGSTQKELAAQIKYLKVENEILRSKLPARVPVTEKERNRLVRFGAKLGKALGKLVTIVHPDTLRRWIRDAGKAAKRKPAKKGRPKTKEEIRELIIKLGRENSWGYTRILGELKKLGVKSVSRNTVKAILKEHGLEPGPQRGEGTWDEFLNVHAKTLWQCDFYAKKVLTIKGFRDLYLLVFLHVDSRRVFIAPSTYHPDAAWVERQAEAFLKHAKDAGLDAKMLMHDRDTKFTAAFDEVLEVAEVEVVKSAHRSPNTNAFVERYIQTLQQEVLDYFIVFGEQHMDHLVAEAVAYYHEERPHQGKDNALLMLAAADNKAKKSESPPDVIPISQIEYRERLGGLLKSYHRRAA